MSLASNELNQVHGSFTSCGIKYNGHGRMRTNKTWQCEGSDIMVLQFLDILEKDIRQWNEGSTE